MGQSFTWLGGSLSSASSWSQADPKHPVEPGSTDTVNIAGSGTVKGSVGPAQANLSGTFTLDGSILSTSDAFMGAGTLTLASGSSFGGAGMALSKGTIIQDGGAVSATTAAFEVESGGTYELKSGTINAPGSVLLGFKGSGTMTQSGGTVTAQGLQIFSGDYTLKSGGTLNVGSSLEYIGDKANETGKFTQTGGTHTIAGSLQVGYGATAKGDYLLKNGTLSATSEFIGQNTDGSVTQRGASTTTLSDRIVLGINLTSGAAGTGTYTLGGTGNLKVGVIYVGSDPGCTGTFNYDTGGKDKATLTITGEKGLPDLIVGGQGNGTFVQDSSLKATLAVGYRTGSTGVYDLKAGVLTSTSEIVGDAAKNATFNQSSGSNEMTGASALQVGLMDGAAGTYNLTSGHMTGGGEEIGVGGKGTFIEDGDPQFTSNTCSKLILGVQRTGEGTYRLEAGKLTVGKEIIGDKGRSSFIQTGGDHKVTGSLTIGDDDNGTYKIVGGTLTFAPEASGIFVLGSEAGVKGELTVSKEGTVNTPTLQIGADGDGVLTTENGGVVNVATSVKMGQGSILDTMGGSVTIGTGSAADKGELLIDKSGELSGQGTIKGKVTLVGGEVEALGGKLKIEGNVTGSGTLRIEDKATLDITGTDKIGVHFGSQATLEFGAPAHDFNPKLSGLSVGDQLVLDGVTATAAKIKDGVLTITLSSDVKLTYDVTGSLSNTGFKITTSGGNSTLTLVSTKNAKADSTAHTSAPDSFTFGTTHSGVAADLAAAKAHLADLSSMTAQHTHLAIDGLGNVAFYGHDGFLAHLHTPHIESFAHTGLV